MAGKCQCNRFLMEIDFFFLLYHYFLEDISLFRLL